MYVAVKFRIIIKCVTLKFEVFLFSYRLSNSSTTKGFVASLREVLLRRSSSSAYRRQNTCPVTYALVGSDTESLGRGRKSLRLRSKSDRFDRERTWAAPDVGHHHPGLRRCEQRRTRC